MIDVQNKEAGQGRRSMDTDYRCFLGIAEGLDEGANEGADGF